METRKINYNYMRICYVIATILLVFGGLNTLDAQEIKGIVHDLETSERARGVSVQNLRTKERVETDADGNFSIAGQPNDYLRLTGAGFETDTAFVYDEGIRRIYLVRDENTIVINEVFVTRFTDSRLLAEIEKARRDGKAVDASQHQGGMRISPSRLFGRKGRQARSNLDILVDEYDNRQVDKVFTNQLIRSLVPLTDDEIPLFRSQYRPSLEFVQQASPEDLRVYIADSYSKFKNQ